MQGNKQNNVQKLRIMIHGPRTKKNRVRKTFKLEDRDLQILRPETKKSSRSLRRLIEFSDTNLLTLLTRPRRNREERELANGDENAWFYSTFEGGYFVLYVAASN